MNTRRYPRTMQQAFGPYTDDRLQPMSEPSLTRRLVTFVEVYREYREHHNRRYAARIAHGIAFRGIPF
jgi:hypothetical protein